MSNEVNVVIGLLRSAMNDRRSSFSTKAQDVDLVALATSVVDGGHLARLGRAVLIELIRHHVDSLRARRAIVVATAEHENRKSNGGRLQ